MNKHRTEFGQCLWCIINGDETVKRVCSTIGICAECTRTANTSFAVDFRTALRAGESTNSPDGWADASFAELPAS